jgi:hypothetical protein
LGAGKIAEVFGSTVLRIVMGLQEETGTGLGEPGDRTAKGRVLTEGVVMDVPKVGKSAQSSAGRLFQPFGENSRVDCLLGTGIVQSLDHPDMGKRFSGIGATGQNHAILRAGVTLFPGTDGVFNDPGHPTWLKVVMNEGYFHPLSKGAISGCVLALAVSLNLNHRGPFLLHHFLGKLAVVPILHFKPPVKGFKVRYAVQLPLSVQTIEKSLEDTKAHLAKCVSGLVAVHPPVQVRLGKGFQTIFLIEIQKVGSFHPIANGEGNFFKHFTPGSIFSGEGLDNVGELRIK